MEIISSPYDMQQWAGAYRQSGRRLGLVPTMGYLHDGHLSLVRTAREQGRCDAVVMSIYVNPTQFAPHEDLAAYPRDFERDKALAESVGTDVVFYPDNHAMYPPYAQTFVEVTEMTKTMCGRSRPTHFRGVTTVVAKLFHIVQPHVAVFGQKDAQQFFVLRRMVNDLMIPVELIMAPIIREPDGLAMSSRNVYLNPQERKEALCLSQSLAIAKNMFDHHETCAAAIRDAMSRHILKYPTARLDYIALVETERLTDVQTLQKGHLIALAVFIGNTRLIDNIIL